MLRTFDSVSAHVVANTPGSIVPNQTNPSVASTTASVRDMANVGGNPLQKATERLIREEWMHKSV